MVQTNPACATRALDAISHATVRHVTAAFSGVRSIVLTGSLARGEGSLLPVPRGWELLGDAEFLVVFRAASTLPRARRVAALCREIESTLEREGIAAHVGLGTVRPGYLRSLKPHIFAYELAACGRVVWGDDRILGLIPPISARQIPREDAWRLLENRIVEHLEVAGGLLSGSRSLPQSVRYSVAKLDLDMATSLLVFAGAYAPTYRARTANLHRLIAEEAAHNWPFRLAEFAGRVDAALHYKQSPAEAAAASLDLWTSCVEDARRLCRWEMEHLTGCGPGQTWDEIWTRWLAMQGLASRVRGWLCAARNSAHRWREWPQWLRLAPSVSPRHLVYRAANDIFFTLPDQIADGRSDWQPAAQSLLRDYHSFIETTRS